MQVVLVSFRAEGEKRSFSVTRDVTVIGRREDCDLRIPVSEVSRKHCRIIKDGDQLKVEDMGSSNGTYHNGTRVQGSTLLGPGDSVQVGPVVFVVQIDGEPPEDDLAPFAERAAHELDDSVTDDAVAAAAAGSISTAEEDPHAIEESLELMDELPSRSDSRPAGEMDDQLELLDEPVKRSSVAASRSADDELDELGLLDESDGEKEPPLSLSSHEEHGELDLPGEEPAAEPHHDAPGHDDHELAFDLAEDDSAVPTESAIPLNEEDDLLEIPLDLAEEPAHDSPPDNHKHGGH